MTLRRSREESELHDSYARQGTGDLNGMSADDGDNRTRNAKAQRRHREKRKAHLKAVGLGFICFRFAAWSAWI